MIVSGTSCYSLFLLGMPGSGKSTLGKAFAQQRGLRHVDTDTLIEEKFECSLQKISDVQGYLALRNIEEEVLLESDFSCAVVSTGGSVVYSALGMARVKSLGQCIYLNVPVVEIAERVHDFAGRGIAAQKHHTIESLFLEREPLYLKYADHVLDIAHEPLDCSVHRLCRLVDSLNISSKL